MTGAPAPDPLSPRQLQIVQRLIQQRSATELSRLRLGRGEHIRNLRLAQTVQRDGSYPATGDTFAIRFLDCGFSPRSPGSSTQDCQDRTAEGDTDGADDVIAREINGQYVPEGTYVAALWQRGLEGDPEEYGEWWIRLKGGLGECWIFEDNFAKEDTTDLGSDWNEVAGEWGIEDEELVEIYADTEGTGNAQLFCTQPVPADSKGEMFIEIEVPIASVEDGDEYLIWPCCINTSTAGDIEVSFTYNEAMNEWTTTISGGTDEDSATYTTSPTGSPTHVILKVCADHELKLIKAWVSPTANEYAAWDNVDPGDGRYCAIGHTNTAHQNRFDNFSIEELRRGTTVCVNCFCMCEEFGMPPNLTATIVFAEDRAECLGGEEWPMDAVLGPQVVQWEGGLEKYTGYATEELNFRLTCGDGVPNSFTLMHLAPFNCVGESTKNADAAMSTCDPLQLYFGPYTLSFPNDCSLCFEKNQPDCTGMPPISANCSGTFWIVITL